MCPTPTPTTTTTTTMHAASAAADAASAVAVAVAAEEEAAERRDGGGGGGGDWIEEAVAGCSLRRVDLETGTNGWASPPGELFLLRPRGYFHRRRKAPSGEWLLRPAGVDWLRSPSRLDHLLSLPPAAGPAAAAALRRALLRRGGGGPSKSPFLLAVNLQVPARPDPYSAVFYFAADAPLPAGSLLRRFVSADDDAFRNARFKIVNRIVRGPWIVRAAVGNHAACLLGRALTCRYHRGDGYLEIDVDIGSSALASAVLHLALGSAAAVAIDMGFVVEAQADDELPERLIGAVRIAHIDMASAAYLDPKAASPAPSESESEEAEVDAGKGGGCWGPAKVNHHSHHHHRRSADAPAPAPAKDRDG